jgi:tetratricopeptide (TPR) repeat protein
VVAAGYDDELAATTKDVARLESLLSQNPADPGRHVRLAYRQFHRASLTCKPADFEAVNAAISDAVRAFGALEDICLLQATLDLRFHRLAAAKTSLGMQPRLASRFEGRTLLADCDFQEGRYEQARAAFESLLKENRTWDNLARLAHWDSTMGRASEADALYLEAEDELTAKEMRAYAWLELQRGALRASRGAFGKALLHYRRAEAAYPGHWDTDEHLADLFVAEERFDEAVTLLRYVISRVPKPELKQMLGEVLLLADEPRESQALFEQALAAYLDSVEKGEVHYYHHLAHFYTEARPEAAEAVKWAWRDLVLRSNFSTQAALAAALHRAGEVTEALQYIGEALASGVQEWRVFATAADVYEAAGHSAESKRYARAASELNPHGRHLHMHQ